MIFLLKKYKAEGRRDRCTEGRRDIEIRNSRFENLIIPTPIPQIKPQFGWSEDWRVGRND